MVGDLAAFEQDGRPVPGVAPAANQMGATPRATCCGRAREPPRPFRYVDKGSLATIGRRAGGGRHRAASSSSGLPAWLAWLGIHIFFLIGFRNRLVVMFEWALAYFTYQRSARLILNPRLRRTRRRGGRPGARRRAAAAAA